jgi:Protein of unknown function (DUF2500)
MDFFFFTLALLLLPILIYGLIRFDKNASAPLLLREARVIGKRQAVAGNSQMILTTYYVAFELSDRSRIELSVNARNYGVLIEGDIGMLRSQGKRLKGFDRQ